MLLRLLRRRDADEGTFDATAAGLARAERTYNLIQDQVGRADAKAASAITLELAALGGLLTLSTQGRGLPAPAALVAVAAGLWLAAVGAAGLVVFPRLARRGSRAARTGVYFGALRSWTPQQLTMHFSQADSDYLRSLAAQVITVARIAWRKHVCLQASLLLAAAGLGVLAVGLAIGGGNG